MGPQGHAREVRCPMLDCDDECLWTIGLRMPATDLLRVALTCRVWYQVATDVAERKLERRWARWRRLLSAGTKPLVQLVVSELNCMLAVGGKTNRDSGAPGSTSLLLQHLGTATATVEAGLVTTLPTGPTARAAAPGGSGGAAREPDEAVLGEDVVEPHAGVMHMAGIVGGGLGLGVAHTSNPPFVAPAAAAASEGEVCVDWAGGIAPLPQHLRRMCTVALQNIVVVAGGCSGVTTNDITNACYAYVPERNEWVPAPEIGQRRNVAGAVAHRGGMWLIGGCIGAHHLFDTVEHLTPPPPPPSPRRAEPPEAPSAPPAERARASGHHAGVASGQTGLAGGTAARSSSPVRPDQGGVAEVASPAGGGGHLPLAHWRWEQAPSLTAPRARMGVASLGGCLYAVGGYGPIQAPGVLQVMIPGVGNCGALRTAEVLRPGAASWQPVPPLSSARADLALAVFGGALFAIGGETGAFHPVTLNTVERLVPPTQIRAGADGGARGEAGGLAEGGGAGGVQAPRALVRGWERAPSLLVPRSACGAAVVRGRLVVVGGQGPSGVCLSSTEVLSEGAGRWVLVQCAPGPRRPPAVPPPPSPRQSDGASNGPVLVWRALRSSLERDAMALDSLPQRDGGGRAGGSSVAHVSSRQPPRESSGAAHWRALQAGVQRRSGHAWALASIDRKNSLRPGPRTRRARGGGVRVGAGGLSAHPGVPGASGTTAEARAAADAGSHGDDASCGGHVSSADGPGASSPSPSPKRARPRERIVLRSAVEQGGRAASQVAAGHPGEVGARPTSAGGGQATVEAAGGSSAHATAAPEPDIAARSVPGLGAGIDVWRSETRHAHLGTARDQFGLVALRPAYGGWLDGALAERGGAAAAGGPGALTHFGSGAAAAAATAGHFTEDEAAGGDDAVQ